MSVNAQAKSLSKDKVRVLFIDELTLRDEQTPSWGQASLNGLYLALGDSKTIDVTPINVYRSPVLAYEAVMQNAGKVDVVLGLRTSAQALMAKKATDQHNLPFLSIMATSDKLITSDIKTSSIMIAARNSFQAKALSKELWPNSAPNLRVGIVVMKNCVYCDEMSEMVQVELKKKGIPVEIMGQTLFQEPVSKSLFARSGEFSHIGLFTDEVGGMAAIALLKQTAYKGYVFGGDSWSINTIAAKDRSPYSDICLVNAVTHSKSRMRNSFVKEYKKKFKSDPTDLALLGYDAGLVIKMLVNQCADRKPSLKECFASKIGSLQAEGASGKISFYKDGGRTEDSLVIEKYGCKQSEI